MVSFLDLPEPLAETVLKAVPDACASHPQTLLSLACTSTWFATKLQQPSANPLWSAAWSAAKRKRSAAAAEEQKIAHTLTVSFRDKLRLAGFVGCTLCGAKAIRKVYWEFGVRCCKNCLIQHSAEYHLKEEYGLDPSSFQHLPSRDVGTYHPKKHHFTMTTYWKDHLVPVLQQTGHNIQSFEEFEQQHDSAKKKEMVAKAEEEKVRKAKRAERCEQLQEWCQEDNVDLQAANMSDTYRRNCNLALPLKRKAYDRLLPIINMEIEHKQQQVEAQKIAMEEQQQQALAKKQKLAEDHASDRVRNLTCSVCGGARLFAKPGLREHTRAKHPHQQPSTLQA